VAHRTASCAPFPQRTSGLGPDAGRIVEKALIEF